MFFFFFLWDCLLGLWLSSDMVSVFNQKTFHARFIFSYFFSSLNSRSFWLWSVVCVYLNLNFSCVLCYRYRSLFQIKVCVCSVFFSFCCCCLVLISETLQVSRNTQKWHGHASELRAEHFFWMCTGKTQNALYFWRSINIFCHQKTCHKKFLLHLFYGYCMFT